MKIKVEVNSNEMTLTNNVYHHQIWLSQENHLYFQTIPYLFLYNKLGIPWRFIAFFLTHFFTQNDILLNIFQYQKRWRARKGSNKGLYLNRFIRKSSNIKAATSESVIFRKNGMCNNSHIYAKNTIFSTILFFNNHYICSKTI